MDHAPRSVTPTLPTWKFSVRCLVNAAVPNPAKRLIPRDIWRDVWRYTPHPNIWTLQAATVRLVAEAEARILHRSGANHPRSGSPCATARARSLRRLFSQARPGPEILPLNDRLQHFAYRASGPDGIPGQ
jgi:hypothetical protein